MPLCSFTEPSHIIKLLEGSKRQTTRRERKNMLKVGDTLYCYYKSRMKKSCYNCINYKDCKVGATVGFCSDWNNYFGEAEIVHVRPLDAYQGFMDKWAIADGFSSLDDALKWFDETHGKDWMKHMSEFEVIVFEPKWL